MRRSHQTVHWKQTDQGLPTNKYEGKLPRFMYAAISCVLSMLFVFAAVIMLNNVFPKFQLTSGGMRLLVLEIAAITIWNGLLENGKHRSWRLLGNLVIGAVIVLFLIGYYRLNRLNIQDGLLAIGQQYLDKWNYYYHTAWYVRSWNKQYIDIAFGFVMIAIAAVLQLIASVTKKPWMMILLPSLTLTADLMIGYAPEWFPIAAMFAGILIVFSHTWQRRKQPNQVLCLTALCVAVICATSYIFPRPAATVAAAEDRMKAFQSKLETSVKNFSLFNVNVQDGSVDNHKPTYKDTEVIQVTADVDPGQVYLRGFYGADYTNHGWLSDMEAFEQACEEHSMTSDEGELIISRLPYVVTDQNELAEMNNYGSYINSERNYTIAYTGIVDTYAYLPYGVDISEANAAIDINGDYEFRKARQIDEIQVVGNSGNAYPYSDTYLHQEVEEADDSFEKNSAFTSWYNRYVLSEYLDVPEEQRTAIGIANRLSYEFDEGDETWMERQYGSSGLNIIRSQKAEAVVKYLLMNETYSLDLDVLPKGEDPVEYFLSTSHEGYCVHFASAGVFMLRQMGVPARYVTGYVGKANGAKFNKATNEYEISIKDSNAHAWVEIYMDDFGWMPLEVTPGNSQYWDSRVEMEKESAEDNLTDTSQNNTTANKQEQPDSQANQETDNNQNDSAEETRQSETSGITATETEETRQGDDTSQSGSGTKTQSLDISAVLRIAAAVIGILMVLAAGGYFIFIRPKKRRLHTTKTIKSNMKRGHYKQAVNRINQSLYQDLRKDKKVIGWHKNLTDEEYVRELITAYPQVENKEWMRYINIARKAAYDNRELSEDDARFCFQIYKKHLWKEKKEA